MSGRFEHPPSDDLIQTWWRNSLGINSTISVLTWRWCIPKEPCRGRGQVQVRNRKREKKKKKGIKTLLHTEGASFRSKPIPRRGDGLKTPAGASGESNGGRPTIPFQGGDHCRTGRQTEGRYGQSSLTTHLLTNFPVMEQIQYPPPALLWYQANTSDPR